LPHPIYGREILEIVQWKLDVETLLYKWDGNKLEQRFPTFSRSRTPKQKN